MTDSQNLLAEFRQTGSDAAFRELVTRYVDLVYSTALRLVDGDAHRAQDVAQTVFVNMSHKARTLPADVSLGGWLHRDTCLTAGHVMRGERRRQSRERQAAEMNALQNHSQADYSLVAPLLDEAINELGEADRTAILLRFFEQHDFRAVGRALGSNEDAARMRVNRALEKLEEFLKRRGITTTAASLGVVLTANAVQAAPVGLAITISTAAALAGTTLATATTATAIKTIAMTTLQKTVITATLAIVAGVGIYEARQNSQLREQVQTLQQQQTPLAVQAAQLGQALIEATDQVAGLHAENERLNQNTAELLKLRGQVGMLRKEAGELKQLLEANAQIPHTAEPAKTDSQNAANLQTVAKIVVSRIKQPQTLAEELILKNISVKAGDNFDQLAVDHDVRTLYATGFFSNLRVLKSTNDTGIILNYLLQERPRLAAINFTGNSKFRETELADILASKVGESFDERVLFSDAEMIKECHAKLGFVDTKVKYSTKVNETLGNGEVTFEITE